jgi:uncharacterized RDD family membrane protein YckC
MQRDVRAAEERTMADSGSGNETGKSWGGVTMDVKPHAYDPTDQPELFEGVLSRRIVAFIIDLVIISIPIVLAYIFVTVFTILTLGLGVILFVVVSPLSVIWALCYYGMTLGGPNSATVGMRVMDLQMRTWYGAPAYFLLGAVHAVIFWVSVSVLTPFVLLVGLFNDRRRLLHDMLIGTVVVNNPIRAQVLRGGRP